jgi:hypothetical protein
MRGGYTEPKICLECGQTQGIFPIADPEIDSDDLLDSTPSHTDAALMLNDIMSAKYPNIIAADNPKHRFIGFTGYNTDDKGKEKDTRYYTVPVSDWLTLVKKLPKMKRFMSSRGRSSLERELKNNQNFYEWYEKL